MSELRRDSTLRDLRIQLTDYLLDCNHRIDKLLIDDTAEWVYKYGQALFGQGRMKGHADQFAKDQAEGVEAVVTQTGEQSTNTKASQDTLS